MFLSKYIELRYQVPGGSGIGVIGPEVFRGLSNLTQLTLGNSILNDFHPDAFVPLVKLKYLYIGNMIMRDINLTTIFAPLKHLEKLTLYMTDLDILPPRLMPLENSLRILRVHSNHLRTVDKTMLDLLPRYRNLSKVSQVDLCNTESIDILSIIMLFSRLRELNLRENPLSCTCENSWFKSWAISSTYTQVTEVDSTFHLIYHSKHTLLCVFQVPFLYSLRCDNNRGAPFLWQFKDLACTSEQLSFTLFVSCFVADMLLMCVCLTWHTRGPALRYLWLLLKAKYRGHKGAHGARFQYDAFVSYSSKDEGWVMKKLVPRLERPASGAKVKLCLHHRDFRPGAFVLDNLEAAIYNSRRTICVVTRNFLQSEWCSVEFQLASLRLLFDGSDVLLLLFLEKIPEHCLSPYTRLRKMVHKKTYLMWPEGAQEQEAFWVRLVQVLKDTEEEKETGGILVIN